MALGAFKITNSNGNVVGINLASITANTVGDVINEINKRGQGHEEEAVAAWLKEHPDMVGRMTPQ